MKKLLLIAFALVFSVGVWAESISREQAAQLARKFVTEKGMTGTIHQALPQKARSKALLKGSAEGDGCYYVFNVGERQGFVIVSGDDRSPAILGYSKRGTFDMDHVNPTAAKWLEGYADQIRYIRSQGLQPPSKKVDEYIKDGFNFNVKAPGAYSVKNVKKAPRAAISLMVTSKWSQDAPYYDMCPDYNGQKCVTGCMATAMAQVMYYYRYPTGSTTTIPGYTTETYSIKCESLPATTFDWGSMNDSPQEGTEAGKAVAELMRYCGQSMVADYTLDFTAIYNNMPEVALKNYFGYGSGVKYVPRYYWRDEDWDELIYSELAAGRPVIYSGQADDGGHAFVLHGYDGNGYYQVNWGWAGDSDGWYLLDAMTPTSSGIGSGDTSGAGFNTGQTAIVGISPQDVTIYQPTDDVVALTTSYIVVDEGAVFEKAPGTNKYQVHFYVKFTNALYNDYTFNFDFAVYKDGEQKGLLFDGRLEPIELPIYYYFPWQDQEPHDYFGLLLPYFDDSPLFQEPGNWTIIPVSKKEGEVGWHPNFGSDKYYLTAVIDNDGKMRLYVGDPNGSNPGPDPGSEVTKDDIDALEKQLAPLQSSLEACIDLYEKKADTYGKQTDAIYEYIDRINALMEQMEEAAKALESEDNPMTEEELAPFLERYMALSEIIDAEQEVLLSLIDVFKEQNATFNAVYEALMATINDFNTLGSSYMNILTKSDLEKAQRTIDNLNQSIANMNASLDGIDSDKVDQGLKELEAMADTEAAVKKFAEDFDAAIKAAKEAKEKEEEEEQKALEKAEERLSKAISDLSDQFTQHSANYELLVGMITALDGRIEEIGGIIQKNIATSDAIEQMLNDGAGAPTRAMSDENREKYSKELAALRASLASIVDQRAQLVVESDQLKAQLGMLKEILDAEKTLLDRPMEDNLKTSAEVNKLAEEYETQTKALNDQFEEKYNAFLKNYETVLTESTTVMESALTCQSAFDSLMVLVEAAQTGIRSLIKDESEIEGRYDANGRKVGSRQKGTQIIRMRTGKTYKVFVR